MPETAKHRRAFDIYWRLGPERSIERLHAELAQAGASSACARSTGGPAATTGRTACLI